MIDTSRPPATGTTPDQSPVTPRYLQYCLTKYNHRCATGHTTIDQVAAALGLTPRPDTDPHRWVTSVLNTMINSSTEPDHLRCTPTGGGSVMLIVGLCPDRAERRLPSWRRQ